MATTPKRIWIEEGCIHCFWCQNLAPQVFEAGLESTHIAGAVRMDGRTSDNRREHSPLRTDILADADLAFLPFVADGCPVQVIHLDGGWSDLGVADPGLVVRG